MNFNDDVSAVSNLSILMSKFDVIRPLQFSLSSENLCITSSQINSWWYCQSFLNIWDLSSLALSSGGKDPEVITDDVLKVIERWKLRKPTIYAIEIQNRLLRENICVTQNVLSLRSIQRAIRNNLNMTRKKVTCVPLEYNTPETC